MKLTRDMAIFDDNLPLGVKLVGYVLGFMLTVAGHIDRVLSKFVLSAPRYKPDSWHRSNRLQTKRLHRRK